jgi:hypothetical protein
MSESYQRKRIKEKRTSSLTDFAKPAACLLTAYNCVRVLCSFGTPDQIASIPVYQGAATPLVQEPKAKSTVHGVDGLGGVEGLLDLSYVRHILSALVSVVLTLLTVQISHRSC